MERKSPDLEVVAANWPSPNTMPSAPNGGLNRGAGKIRARKTSQCLEQMALFATPNAGDAIRGMQKPDGKRGLLLLTDVRGLQDLSALGYGQMSLPDVPSSPHPSQKRRLNPYFEEWLMGLPIGWTGFAAMGLESYPSWRRRLSSIWPRVLELGDDGGWKG